MIGLGLLPQLDVASSRLPLQDPGLAQACARGNFEIQRSWLRKEKNRLRPATTMCRAALFENSAIRATNPGGCGKKDGVLLTQNNAVSSHERSSRLPTGLGPWWLSWGPLPLHRERSDLGRISDPRAIGGGGNPYRPAGVRGVPGRTGTWRVGAPVSSLEVGL